MHRPSLHLLVLLDALAVAPLAGCGETPDRASDVDNIEESEGEKESRPDASGKPPRVDASTAKPGPVTPRSDAGVTKPTPSLDGGIVATPPARDAGPPPDPFAPGDRTPSPSNIKECPPVAPADPIGSCLGVPIYATCSYTTYNCICDWYHWICI